jgi:branched-chain amino acid transport system ATP-binding protein
MLKAEHVSVSYGPHRALDDVSVRVEQGEIVVILGANGAGKSTLLRAIAGLIKAPNAAVAIEGHDLAGKPANRIVEAGIALVPEGRGIFGELTVAENLALGAYGKQARAEKDARLRQVLELFPKLGERRGQVARTMSGGEQQMVAVGRALMSNPKILMLDEPSLGLSPLLSTELFRTLKAIGETGVGILLVEQNARQSLAIADRAYLLENGRIVGEGRAAAMLDDPAVQKAYLGGGTSTHKPFGLEPVAPPMAPAGPATIEGMVERAAQIHRAHTRDEHKRLINGHAAELFITHVQSPQPIVVATSASALSAQAADLAERARAISAAHVAAQRAARQIEVRPTLALPPPSGVVIEPPKATEKAKKAKKK